MKELIIIGAGNVGGFLALNQDLFEGTYQILGFLDDDTKKQGKRFWEIPVLGMIDTIGQYTGCSVAVGISSPLVKKEFWSESVKTLIFQISFQKMPGYPNR